MPGLRKRKEELLYDSLLASMRESYGKQQEDLDEEEEDEECEPLG